MKPGPRTAWHPPIPAEDEARVAALRRLDVLDRPRRPDLDALARIAAYVCDAPRASINLIDADRQWSAAAYGCEPPMATRRESMCAVAIASPDVSYTPDASRDERWRGNPFVNGVRDRVRLYASAPLVLPGGEVIGTICATSPRPAKLTRLQLERLRDVADQAVWLLELRQTATMLSQAATRDPLTGLPNRVLFYDSLRRAATAQGEDRTRCAVLFADLDGFKVVNDTWGHAAGDEVLRIVARRLLATVRATDLLARLAGDEFVVLCQAPTTTALRAAVQSMSGRIRQALDQPVPLPQSPVRLGVSIGAAYSDQLEQEWGDPAGAADAVAELMARADAAMYDDKRRRDIRAG